MDTTAHHPDLTLVTCGTGKTGRRVASRLTAARHAVRVGSRSAHPPFDWSDRATWEPALADVDAVYLAYLPDIGAPSAPADIGAFADLATSMGVRRAVLLSGRGEQQAQRCEEVVRSRPWDWTIVRSAVFSQDFSEAFLYEPVLSGVVAFPAGRVAEPFVDADDVADVAVAALTEAGHAGQTYEVTGPRSLTFAEAVAAIGAATHRSLRYVPVPPDAYAAALVEEAGLPSEEAGFLAALFTTLFDGRNAATTDGVERALGRAPRDFTDYVRRTAREGVWDVAAPVAPPISEPATP
ncbi:NAD(P)H-binding protein [Mumia qirimensis]|uniref:NAD(P)H-binding protein n=1 Tax=Mumia qirimensis TaxID=3234852 RepID=UPI00351CF1E3